MTTSIEKSAAFLGALVITAAVASTCFAAEKTAAPAHNATPAIQTITITAKRMTPTQKFVYDKEQENLGVQVVLVSAKRFSAEEKLAFDKSQAKQAQASSEYNKVLRKTI